MVIRSRAAARRLGAALAALVAVVLAVSACADPPADAQSASSGTAGSAVATSIARRPPALSLGAGLVRFPDPARVWVRDHPNDWRTPLIHSRISTGATALWLTGDESFGNLALDASMAHASNRTMLLTLYNIPLRWDGLSSASGISLAQYEQWVSKVATGLHGNRAIVVLEPDALWFYDRLPSATDRQQRMTALRYAVHAITRADSRARVYIDAGTSSGSVTPSRMADLLVQADIAHAAGYAVNVSSYSPNARIQDYAQRIRSALQARHISNPRYVVDTGRNGAASWDNDWCNPPGQRLGSAPKAVRSWHGLDLNLWIKGPGTSDGSCGAGLGSYGGQFLPSLAYRMITG